MGDFFYERRRAQNSDSICKTRSWKKNVSRPKYTYSNQSWCFRRIILFAFFYVTIQYNPVEIANNLRQNNGSIPGIRPGKPTSDYIAKILSKITLIGALFLAVIALVPMIYTSASGMHELTMGGTSIIILVGVALETIKQMESQMQMRNYKGFLD